MDMKITGAAQAYAKALQRAQGIGEGAGGAEPTGAAGVEGFGKLVEKLAGDATQSAQKAEATGLKAALGKADINDVVAAVNNAEVALETVVAVRDRVISAYQEIMRMPI